MIPRSTTLTDEGRKVRSRAVWAGAAVLSLLLLALVFAALDRSTVIDGPAGSSHVTTATGVAAVHDVFSRDGRDPERLERPVTGAALSGADAYFASDIQFGRFEGSELLALDEFVDRGGTLLLSGLPPPQLLDEFEIEIDWRGESAGRVDATRTSLPAVTAVEGARFGSFAPEHDGRMLAGSDSTHLAVAFDRGRGEVILVADSSVAHNATVDLADNIDFLGGLLTGRTVFDEYRHGYDNTPATGMLTAAPGNWTGAAVVGAVVLALALATYGRRFGPVEPRDRLMAPDRSTYIDSVGRSLVQTGSLPVDPLRAAVCRQLDLPADTPLPDLAQASRRAGVDESIVAGLEHPGDDLPMALDHVLAALTTRRG